MREKSYADRPSTPPETLPPGVQNRREHVIHSGYMDDARDDRSPDIILLSRNLWFSGLFKMVLGEAKELDRRGVPNLLVFMLGSSGAPWLLPLLGKHRVSLVRGFPRHDVLSVASYILTKLLSPISSFEARVDLAAVFLTYRFLRRQTSAQLLCHDQYSGLSGLLLKLLNGADYFVFVHDRTSEEINYRSPLQRKLGGAIDRLVLKRSKGIFTNSQATRGSVARLLSGTRSPPLYLARCPALDHSTRTLRTGDKDSMKPVVLVVTTWEAGRFPFWYARVASFLKKGSMRLVGVWKDPAELTRVRGYITDNHLEERVTIVGEVTEAQLQEEYERASLFLRIGRRESGPGFGILEALGHGLPIVTNRGLGGSEILEGNSEEVVLPEDDPSLIPPAKLAAVLDSILSNPERLELMRDSALRIAAGLSWESHIETILKGMHYPQRERGNQCFARGTESSPRTPSH
jgi:glycosyltransferase involved in cell wall biosynthesis